MLQNSCLRQAKEFEINGTFRKSPLIPQKVPSESKTTKLLKIISK